MRGREKKKGQTGSTVTFVSRNQALKKLQVSLAEFRKLCILKGVFPRDPGKRAHRGKDKTYFLAKDILCLSHDPLLTTFRQYRTHKRKVRRAENRSEPALARSLRQNKPDYQLDHVIKERYPTFIDALRDMNDALSMLFLFSNHPNTHKVHATRVQNCRRLALEWEAYIAHAHALRKVFLSIKGIHYQAVVCEQEITWTVPYQFTLKPSKDIDYKVMMTFMDFYETLIGFINFKLYSSLGLSYPPQLDIERDEAAQHLGAIKLEAPPPPLPSSPTLATTVEYPAEQQLQSVSDESNMQLEEQTKERISSLPTLFKKIENSETIETQLMEEDAAEEVPIPNESTLLFANCKFFLSRETPIRALEFIIKSQGGQVSWAGSLAPYIEQDQSVTHQVVDRDSKGHRFLSRDYVQPQWVFDSVNECILLPTEDYAPGVELPAHLSPFVDDEAQGHIPEQRKRLNALKQSFLSGGIMPEEEEESSTAIQEEDLDQIEDQYTRELVAERAGKAYKTGNTEDNVEEEEEEEKPVVSKPAKKKRKRALEPQLTKEEEERESKKRAVMMMPKKKRDLYNKIMKGVKKKEKRVRQLDTRAKKAAKSK